MAAITICNDLFFAVKLYEFLIYCEYYPFIRYMLYKYLLPFSRLPFYFVDGFLCCAQAAFFDVVPIVYFCLGYMIQKKVIAKVDVKEFTICVFLLGVLCFQVLCSSI